MLIYKITKQQQYLFCKKYSNHLVTKYFIVNYLPLNKEHQLKHRDIQYNHTQLLLYNSNVHFFRVGFIVIKKLYKYAHQRNFVKRRIRSLIQTVLKNKSLPYYDYVILARKGCNIVSYNTLESDLNHCLLKQKKIMLRANKLVV